VASPARVPTAKATKRVAPAPRRLYTTLETLIFLITLCESKLDYISNHVGTDVGCCFFCRARVRGALLQDAEENDDV